MLHHCSVSCAYNVEDPHKRPRRLLHTHCIDLVVGATPYHDIHLLSVAAIVDIGIPVDMESTK